MLYNNHVFTKNGYTPSYDSNNNYVHWTLSFNMATKILIVSEDGKVFNVSFRDELKVLFDYATQMSITIDALVFYVPMSSVDVQQFFVMNLISYTGSTMLEPEVQKVVLNDTIRCVLTDIVNINMFHMMSQSMMMDIDVNDTVDGIDAIDIDDDWFFDDLMDLDVCGLAW